MKLIPTVVPREVGNLKMRQYRFIDQNKTIFDEILESPDTNGFSSTFYNHSLLNLHKKIFIVGLLDSVYIKGDFICTSGPE